MVEFEFLIEPEGKQLLRIGELYRDAGWWRDAPEEMDKIRAVVAGSHCFLVAVHETEIVGMGRAISDGVSDAYIQDVTVYKSWRGRGIAGRIVRELVARLRRNDMSWIGLVAERGTHDLYKKLGFKEMPQSVPLLLQDDPDAL